MMYLRKFPWIISFLLFTHIGHAAISECRSDGGSAVCFDPDFSEWKYHACDEAGPYVYRYRIWCEVQGGVYHGVYEGCEGAEAFTEENISPFSREFERRVHGACEINEPPLVWGSTSDSYQCWKVQEYAINGTIVRSGAKLPYAGKSEDRDGQCSVPWEEAVYARRDRLPECPQGAYLRYTNQERTKAECVVEPDYWLEIQDWPACRDREGNPCDPANGRKVQTERDVSLPSGLNFSRHRSSTTDASQATYWNFTG